MYYELYFITLPYKMTSSVPAFSVAMDTSYGHEAAGDYNNNNNNNNDNASYTYNYNYDDYYELSAEEEAADAISRYVAPVLLFTGLAGNVLSLLVHVRLGRAHMSTCYYLAVLAVVDSLLLVHRLGSDWARHAFKTDLQAAVQNRSELTCQLFNLATSFLLHFSHWLLAVAVLEVALARARPKRVDKICRRPERVKNVTLTVVLFLVLVNAHFFWTYGLMSAVQYSDELFCTFTSKGGSYADVFRHRIWPVMDLVVASALPDAFIVASVGYIWRRRRDDVTTAAASRDVNITSARDVHHVARTCVALGVAAVLLTLPENAYSVFEFLCENHVYQVDNTDLTALARRILGQTVCFTCHDIFIAGKVLFYVACWPRFRSCAVEVIKCTNEKRQRNRSDRKCTSNQASRR